MTKALILIATVVVVLYLCICVALYAFQRSLLYFPIKNDVAPASVGLQDAEVHLLKTTDGETIVSWFVRRPGSYVAIYLHGNGDALAVQPDRINELADLGLSVLAIDYRNYGGSTGQPTEAGLHLDAEAAYDEALKRGFAADHVILLGESLGSGPALKLATRHQVAGLILDCPYSSVVDVAAERFWMVPVRWLLADQYRSDLWIPQVHVPILILHGTNDETIPIRFGRRLAALGGANVTFFEVPGAGHVVFDEDAADGPIREWLKQFGF